MNFFLVLIFLLFLNSCSFDNKTGIWENEGISNTKDKEIFKDFKKISISEEVLNKEVLLKKDFDLKISEPINNLSWNDIFFSLNNNLKNFRYSDSNKLLFKSKKLSKNSISNYKLFSDGNLIINDDKGNIIVFSTINNKIIAKFNFYKKKFKRIKKKLNFIVENDLIFVADNLGYSYAYNYKINKIIWAKNHKIPFNSNLKLIKNKIAVSNINNSLLLLNKDNGDLLKLIPTEETFIKNQFKNNLSADNENRLFFLNSFGSLYSVNTKNMTLNWFNNFNQSLDLTSPNIFDGSKIINTDKVIIISSGKKTFFIDIKTGSLIKSFNFSSQKKPIVSNNYVFLISKNNFLICLDLNLKNIIYSYDLSKIKDFKNKKAKKNIYKDFVLLNNHIYIFLNNLNVLKFDTNGKLKTTFKLPKKMNTSPIIIENSIMYLSQNNKLIVLN